MINIVHYGMPILIVMLAIVWWSDLFNLTENLQLFVDVACLFYPKLA
jgi:hypothetical protein